MKKELSSLLSLVCVFSLGVAGMACGADALAEGFADPPAESRPRTWWHWMDNNISRAGITKDLEAMGPTSKIRSDLILEVFVCTTNRAGSPVAPAHLLFQSTQETRVRKSERRRSLFAFKYDISNMI